VIGGGIEVEVTQEARQTVQSKVVPVTFAVVPYLLVPCLPGHAWFRGTGYFSASLRYR
jgi:hypothetical protein